MDKTAFVFAGGGSLGAIQVGMLRELISWGVTPDMVVGASAGAINAAYFACHPDADGAARLESLWRGIRRTEIMPWSWRSLFAMFTRRQGYLVDAGGLRKLLARNFGQTRVENTPVQLNVVATDMINGEEVVLSEGDIVDAVLASAAIPGVYPPVRVNGRVLIDGGVANNTPISTAVRLGATQIVVMPAGFTCSQRREPRGAIEHALNALSLLVARQLVHDLEHWKNHAHIAVVPPLCPLDISPYDYTRCGELIDRAAANTQSWLQGSGLELVRHVPSALHPHTHDDEHPACSMEPHQHPHPHAHADGHGAQASASLQQ